MIKVGMADLRLGIPVPFDAYDKSGKLLIRKGLVLESKHQIEVLIRQGLYIRSKHERGVVKTAPEQKQEPAVFSAMTILTRELRALESLLKIVRGKVEHPDIQSAFMATTKNIYNVVDKHRDICLASVLFNKNAENYPIRHSLDTAILSTVVALSTGSTAGETLGIIAASLTMNVSMLQLQEKLLSKPDKPSQDELDKINRHPRASRQLLEQAGIVDTGWLDYVLYHHEKNDGSGYPHGLTESAIPEGAKIICLADRYTAMITPRLYRPGVLPNLALRNLLINQGNTLELKHIGVLTKVVGIYPPGMFVRLRNGEIAVVVGRGEDGACPKVKSIIDANNNPLPFPVARKTSERSTYIMCSVTLQPEEVPFDMVKIWGEESKKQDVS